MKRSPIAPVSKKRRKENRKRKKLTDSMKANGPVMCQFLQRVPVDDHSYCVDGCGFRADDLHEVVSRARGGSITDPENCVPLCRQHHRWVTEHPLEAAELGLSKRKEGLAK